MEDEGLCDPQLELSAIVGFNGTVPNGLIVHPDRQHLIFPLGNIVIKEDIVKHTQPFFKGHTDVVSCIAVSKSGKYLASGQVTHMGFKADVIIWNNETRQLKHKLTLHKVKVESLAFSANEKYLVTLGGRDDGSVVVWNVATGQAICGSPAAVLSAGTTYCVTCANTSDDKFVTGGNGTIRVWDLDLANRKIRPADINMGQLKRRVTCIVMAKDDKFFYCGTTSGDILKINAENRILNSYGPAKGKFSLGVTALALLTIENETCLLVGAGDGEVATVKDGSFKRIKSSKVNGAAVTSLALRGQGHQFFVGTDCSEVYKFNMSNFTCEKEKSCHSSAVYDVVFPLGSSELFATCSKNDIRVWETAGKKELLRITVPNMTCNAIDMRYDGGAILSGWDDGKIRVFSPESGKLMYEIKDAHNKGVSALAVTSNGSRIISGGGEGQLRVWDCHEKSASLKTNMKEHKAAVKCIKVCKNDLECVSASLDGTCIIWDLVRFVRHQVIFANTLFMCVNYSADESQIITSGSDRKIGYWTVYDGSQIRELEGSKLGSVNGMDISGDGEHFVTAGDDKLVKLWNYHKGEVVCVGVGHSGAITRLKMCPNLRHIVSTSDDGGILIWHYPECIPKTD